MFGALWIGLCLAALGADAWSTVVPETKEATESQIRPVGPYWKAKIALTNEVTKRFTLKAGEKMVRVENADTVKFNDCLIGRRGASARDLTDADVLKGKGRKSAM